MIYFDNAATTAVCKEAADAAYKVMTDVYGNPSSLHSAGLEAEKIIENARQKIAEKLNTEKDRVYFTSGGTESDNIAVFGGALRGGGRKTLIYSAAEHPAVSAPMKELEKKGFNVQKINLLPSGTIDLAHLEKLLTDDTAIVSIMHINNETGCIMPIKDAVKLVRKKTPHALIHSDMVQAFTKAEPEDVDLISVSSHKIHGPKGCGALYVKKGVNISPRVFGGGQEKKLRPGTQNLPGIAGFAAAAELVDTQKEYEHAQKLKNLFLNGISDLDDIKINGENTIPQILNVSFKGTRSEVMLHMLESEGIMVSSGSACSSNSPSPSPVLTAMGLAPEYVDSALRFSFSRYNTEDEVEMCVKTIKKHLGTVRRMMK